MTDEIRKEAPRTMMFADDIVICSESKEQVEEKLERWRYALERRGMKVNTLQEIKVLKGPFENHEVLRGTLGTFKSKKKLMCGALKHPYSVIQSTVAWGGVLRGPLDSIGVP